MLFLFVFLVWISVYVSFGSNVWFILFLGHSQPSLNFGIDSAASSVIKKANVLTLTKESAAGSSKNFVTKLVAENKVDGEPCETAGERVWVKSGYFDDIRTDYNMENVNFPEKSLFYVNQAYLTIQKSQKIYYADYFLIGQIIEAANPPDDI